MIWIEELWQRDRWPNFSYNEMACSHCGVNGMDPELMDGLQWLRDQLEAPIIVNSAYRCVHHPDERRKHNYEPHPHPLGKAADVSAHGPAAYRLVGLAMIESRFSGIGISLRNGRPHFVHLDICTAADLKNIVPRPTMWSY